MLVKDPLGDMSRIVETSMRVISPCQLVKSAGLSPFSAFFLQSSSGPCPMGSLFFSYDSCDFFFFRVDIYSQL